MSACTQCTLIHLEMEHLDGTVCQMRFILGSVVVDPPVLVSGGGFDLIWHSVPVGSGLVECVWT